MCAFKNTYRIRSKVCESKMPAERELRSLSLSVLLKVHAHMQRYAKVVPL